MTSSSFTIDDAVGMMARSIQLRLEQLPREALACLDDLLARAPDFAPAFLGRAEVLADLGRYDEGLAEFRKYPAAMQAAPEIAAFRQQMRDAAVVHYTQPRDPAQQFEVGDSAFRLGNVYLHTGDYAQAELAYAALLAAQPDHAGALSNQGYVRVALHRRADALESYDRLLAAYPDDAVAHYNRGNVLKDVGQLAGALAAYGQAVRLRPDFAEAQLEIAHCRLTAGQFAAGWRQFEWRWQTAQQARHYLASGQPVWPAQAGGGAVTGHAELVPGGGTLLVWAEQGLGDTLQFARFVPQAADRVGRLVLRVPASLVTLLATLDARIEVIDDRQPLPPHDYHCPLMSLPMLLELECVAPAAGAAYLAAAATRLSTRPPAFSSVSAPAAVQGPSPRRPRIGVAWAGAQTGLPNPTRDIPLGALSPLAALDADLVCLQKELTLPDAATWRQLSALAPQPFDDFSDTAALIAQLDLVISVDTAVAHLAGALGKPCWLLLRQSGEWRWQLQRSDTPWYPSMRIFRQRTQGDWSDVIGEVHAACVADLADTASWANTASQADAGRRAGAWLSRLSGAWPGALQSARTFSQARALKRI